MKSRKRSKPDLRALCAEVHPDDGVDPRDVFSREAGSRQKVSRKDRQLCKQISQVLACALSGQCADPVLQDLRVVCVEPTSDPSRLLATVELASLGGQVSVEDVLGRLKQVQGFLRSEMAASITRKRTPELGFAVRPREEVRP